MEVLWLNRSMLGHVIKDFKMFSTLLIIFIRSFKFFINSFQTLPIHFLTAYWTVLAVLQFLMVVIAPGVKGVRQVLHFPIPMVNGGIRHVGTIKQPLFPPVLPVFLELILLLLEISC
jgi:hypothetical protein